MATAYVALALLGASLLTGPINVLLRRANPVSSDSRRDIGVWAGVMSLAHALIGLQVHMDHRWKYFLSEDHHGDGRTLRLDAFGLTNWVGLAAVLVATVLLVLSNDLSLRTLGTSRWKWLQRTNYLFAAAVIAHGIVYQLLEHRTPPYAWALGVLVAIPMVLQVAGVIAMLSGRGVRRLARTGDT